MNEIFGIWADCEFAIPATRSCSTKLQLCVGVCLQLPEPEQHVCTLTFPQFPKCSLDCVMSFTNFMQTFTMEHDCKINLHSFQKSWQCQREVKEGQIPQLNNFKQTKKNTLKFKKLHLKLKGRKTASRDCFKCLGFLFLLKTKWPWLYSVAVKSERKR